MLYKVGETAISRFIGQISIVYPERQGAAEYFFVKIFEIEDTIDCHSAIVYMEVLSGQDR